MDIDEGIARAAMWAKKLSQTDRMRLIIEISDGLPWGNLRNFRRYIEACPDLSIFNGCFPRRIAPGDVDGEVEINGHLFRYDYKTMSGEISGGAWYTATNLARQRGDLTLFAWGDNHEIVAMQVCHPGGVWTEKVAADKQSVREVAASWAHEADQDRDRPYGLNTGEAV